MWGLALANDRPARRSVTASTIPPSQVARRWGLALVCAAQFVLAIDFTVANVALAKIQPALHFAPAQLQWVLSGYVLTFGSLLIFGGRLGDLVGHRRLLLFALGLFGITSLAAGLAPRAAMLVVARIFQGAAAALIAPAALAMLTALLRRGPRPSSGARILPRQCCGRGDSGDRARRVADSSTSGGARSSS